MKHPLGFSVVRTHRRAAFTLIELLAVMAIILVLAGLILNIAGSAQYNAAKSRATSEIKALETALENYKADNGAYPSDSSTASGGTYTTETLDAQKQIDPKDYKTASEYLYRTLSGFTLDPTTGNPTGAVTKPYMTFTVQQLGAFTAGATVLPSSPDMYIMDPFGFSYGYSTIYAKKLADNNAKTPPDTSAITVGYNPTFDLWSTGGYASAGKSTPKNMTGTTAAIYSSLWIKNW